MSHYKTMFYLFLILVIMKICYGAKARSCAKYDEPCRSAFQCCSYDADPRCVICRPRYHIFGTKICSRRWYTTNRNNPCSQVPRRYGCGGDGDRCGRK
ncbi:unnamed protein product [Adineta steineri]|uniref:Uncharacterized protein n=1 Tax=Adineta steineri TaxID=433720 RepID=A0A815B012_9BILA|nr:unnamed protein product [Adineta steineri]CAF1417088.1 unnamed protein product [Adineta steineri]